MASNVPRALYEPVLLSEEGNVDYQAGAFTSEQEAEKVLEIRRAEGRTEEMAINIVPLYESAEGWRADR